MQPIYDIRSLEHAYGGRPVLSIEDLKIKPSSIVGLIGPNGSGKSTLLRLLGLIEKPARGKILFNGSSVEPFSDKARFQVTLLPQEPFLMKRSVFKNVSYGLKLRGDLSDAEERVSQALSQVGLSSRHFMKRPWYALSGGETQRVALAARLVLKPNVLLLDEPTAGVDGASAQLIRQASLNARREWGTTLIIASHDWHWLYEVCDEILHMFNGRIFGTGRESVVLGPWQEMGKNLWGKMLSDGQYLMVPAPPHKDAAAIIDIKAITLHDSKIDEEDDLLPGTVSRISLEKSSGQVLATIAVGAQTFTVKLTPKQTKEQSLFPGTKVFLHYSPERVKWI